MWVAGLADDFKKAAFLARKAIESGKAEQVLKDYIKLSSEAKGGTNQDEEEQNQEQEEKIQAEKDEKKSILHTIAEHRLACVKISRQKVPYETLMRTSSCMGIPAINVLSRIAVRFFIF